MKSNDLFDTKDLKKLNNGPWNLQQCLKYLVFLDQNKVAMVSKQKKKHYRVFDQMSEFLATRNSLQCRSHHQKAIQKYKQVRRIIQHEKQLIDQSDLRTSAKLKNIILNKNKQESEQIIVDIRNQNAKPQQQQKINFLNNKINPEPTMINLPFQSTENYSQNNLLINTQQMVVYPYDYNSNLNYQLYFCTIFNSFPVVNFFHYS